LTGHDSESPRAPRKAQEVAVTPRIPDLWRAKEDAARLYSLYLVRLQMNRLRERVVSACRQIRRYAARGPGGAKGVFTFDFEIDALCKLKDYRTAWRQLRLREEAAFGQRFDLARREWSAVDGWDLAFFHAPLLFFLERYRQGCSLLETALSFHLGGRKRRSYDILFHVYNGGREPENRYGVALWHFYTHLGRELNEWQHWKALVKGFDPRLFQVAGVGRDELLEDSGRLPSFCDRLRAVQAERTISGVTWGLADLVEGPEVVRKRQEATRAQRNEFEERSKPARERIDAKLKELFPELRELPR
jgi:hypothetical protein